MKPCPSKLQFLIRNKAICFTFINFSVHHFLLQSLYIILSEVSCFDEDKQYFSEMLQFFSEMYPHSSRFKNNSPHAFRHSNDQFAVLMILDLEMVQRDKYHV